MMKTKKTFADKATKSPFGGKAAIKREQTKAGFQSAEREQARRGFLGNGMSRTAMLFKIATLGGGKTDCPAVE